MSESNKFIRVSLTDYKVSTKQISVEEFWKRRLKAEGVELCLTAPSYTWTYKTLTSQSSSEYRTPGFALIAAVRDLVVFVDAMGEISVVEPEAALHECLTKQGKLEIDAQKSTVTPEIRDYIEERLSVLVEAYALGKQPVVTKPVSELAKEQGFVTCDQVGSKSLLPKSLQHLIVKLHEDAEGGVAANCFDLLAAVNILKWVTEPLDFINGAPHRPWPAPGTEVEFVVDTQHNDVRWSRGLKTGTRVKILARYYDLVIFSFTTRSGNIGYEGAQTRCFRELSAVEQGAKS